MSENCATVESPTARTADQQRPGRSLHRRFVGALTALSVTRLGAVALVAFALYVAVVVPADFALLLVAALFSVGVAAMVPLLTVIVVTRFVD